MAFLLDTDICSLHLRGNAAITSKFLQYGGRLSISAVTLAELNTWIYRKNTPSKFVVGMAAMLRDIRVIPIDDAVAELFGRVGAELSDQGITVPTPDLLIASSALVHGLCLVTHNLQHFTAVPGLQVLDWSVS